MPLWPKEEITDFTDKAIKNFDSVRGIEVERGGRILSDLDTPNTDGPLTLQELGQVTGVKPYILRFWETEFSELDPVCDSVGRKLYDIRDIEVVLTIKKFLFDEKLSIEKAKLRMMETFNDRGPISERIYQESLDNYHEAEKNSDQVNNPNELPLLIKKHENVLSHLSSAKGKIKDLMSYLDEIENQLS